jgi:hypothetical protein
MKRVVASAVLIILIGGPLARDESWTPEKYAEVAQRFLIAQEAPGVICDCANPSPECEEPCRPNKRRECGWYLGEMDRQVREAIEEGVRPDVFAQVISQHPAPFSRTFLVELQR